MSYFYNGCQDLEGMNDMLLAISIYTCSPCQDMTSSCSEGDLRGVRRLRQDPEKFSFQDFHTNYL
jgi:hypothetical protein